MDTETIGDCDGGGGDGEEDDGGGGGGGDGEGEGEGDGAASKNFQSPLRTPTELGAKNSKRPSVKSRPPNGHAGH